MICGVCFEEKEVLHRCQIRDTVTQIPRWFDVCDPCRAEAKDRGILIQEVG